MTFYRLLVHDYFQLGPTEGGRLSTGLAVCIFLMNIYGLRLYTFTRFINVGENTYFGPICLYDSCKATWFHNYNLIVNWSIESVVYYRDNLNVSYKTPCTLNVWNVGIKDAGNYTLETTRQDRPDRPSKYNFVLIVNQTSLDSINTLEHQVSSGAVALDCRYGIVFILYVFIDLLW
nr:glycoprotein vIgFam13 [Elephant endotheliotropic herpesvirus 1A]